MMQKTQGNANAAADGYSTRWQVFSCFFSHWIIWLFKKSSKPGVEFKSVESSSSFPEHYMLFMTLSLIFSPSVELGALLISVLISIPSFLMTNAHLWGGEAWDQEVGGRSREGARQSLPSLPKRHGMHMLSPGGKRLPEETKEDP